jgi:hypothetical protein
MKPLQKNRNISSLTIIVTLVMGLVNIPASASEVYSWTDENGVVNYSDRPPQGQQAQTIDVPEAYLPGTSDAHSPSDTPVVEATDPVDDAEPGVERADVKTAAQERREEISKNRKERREAQAEIDRLCQQHSQRLAQVEPYRRVYYTDDNGETIRLDDNQRLALADMSRAYLAENCD